MKKLVIVAGAAGEIGQAYIKKLLEKEIEVLAILRNKDLSFENNNLRKIKINLDNEVDIDEKLSDIDIDSYGQIIYLHTIGVDKFDPRGYPEIKKMKTIPEDIYDTNVNSFKYLYRYLYRYLLKRINNNGNQKLKVAIIAGAADKHTPFVIESFCESKFILREYIRSGIELYPEKVSGLSINITSTITDSALKVRPFAELTYWLTPKEVAERSIDSLLESRNGYNQIDVIKHSPLFTENYYEDNELLYKKWSAETGIK